LLSRIDGRTSWKTLRQMGGGLTPEEVDRILERFQDFGVLDSGERKPAPPRATVRASDPPPAIDQRLGIPVELQKSILAFEACLAKPYHEILGIERNADAKEVKRAYFRLSREFHPDRYFRKNVGAFGPRLERIFKKVAEAYELLSDPNTRAEIERSLAEMPSPAPAAGDGEYRSTTPQSERIGPDPKQPRGYRVPDRMENLERLRKRFAMPKKVLGERRVRARQLFQAAKVSAHEGRFLEAAASMRLAIAFDPWNDEYKSGFADIQAGVAAARAAELLEQAKTAGGRGEALRLIEEAINYRPFDAALLQQAVALCLEQRESERAQEYQQQLCEVEPEAVEHVARLAKILRLRGQRQQANSALERALKMDPRHPDVKAEQLELRRGLLRQPGGTA
jgi:curved DNA-binding protein CbpA